MKDSSNKEPHKKFYLYGEKNQQYKNFMEEKYHQDQIKPIESIDNKKKKSLSRYLKIWKETKKSRRYFRPI